MQYDSDPLSPCRYCFHTAFSDPMVDPGLPQRQSVEVRAIAFFHDYMPAPPPLVKNLSAELFATRTARKLEPMDMDEGPYGPPIGARAANGLGDGAPREDETELVKAMALSRQLAEEEERELEQALQASIAMHPPVPAAPPSAMAGIAAASRAAGAAAASQKPALSAELQVTIRTMAERGGQGAEAIAAMLGLELKAVQDTLNPPAVDISEGGAPPLPPVLAESAVIMAGRGMAAVQIAQVLQVEAVSVEATLKSHGGAGGAAPALKRQRSEQLDQAMAAEERAFNEAIRASLAAELGHVSRQVSFDMDL